MASVSSIWRTSVSSVSPKDVSFTAERLLKNPPKNASLIRLNINFVGQFCWKTLWSFSEERQFHYTTSVMWKNVMEFLWRTSDSLNNVSFATPGVQLWFKLAMTTPSAWWQKSHSTYMTYRLSLRPGVWFNSNDDRGLLCTKNISSRLHNNILFNTQLGRRWATRTTKQEKNMFSL